MKKLFIFLLFLPILGFSQLQLSDRAKISIITLGPWQGELYSAFGHSAIRVADPENRIDLAYNYGVFDFNQPNFYLNFARGYLYYKLGVYYYRDFEHHYIAENRYVHEQVLNLTTAEKQKLFDYLDWNSQPENQHYRYDYFYNNCATKMRDVVLAVFGDSVTFKGDHITTNYTIRELTDLYLYTQPWGDLGIDICLGLPMDKKAAPIEYMFLPDYVEQGFDNAVISRNGEAVALVSQKNVIYQSTDKKVELGFFQPLQVFGIVFMIAAIISWNDFRRKKASTFFDTVFFTLLGLLGCLFLFLWVGTDHNAAAKNLNLLWAIPLHLVAAALLLRKPKWLRTYFLVVCILSVALIVFWYALPQKLHYALIPIVMIAALRSYVQYKFFPR